MLRCLTAVFDCGGFTAKGCFGSPARWVRESDASQMRAEAQAERAVEVFGAERRKRCLESDLFGAG